MTTLTTIGYGDFSPITPAPKVITIFYGVNRGIVFLMLIEVIRCMRRWEIGDRSDKTDNTYITYKMEEVMSYDSIVGIDERADMISRNEENFMIY